MSTILPISADDLLSGRSIESVRVEFKASWNADTTGFQVLKTICVFANDHQNLNGGYVVIGVAESASAQDAIDAAILARRLRESRIAHRYFQQAGDAIHTDSRALHEFAQTKIRLAQEAREQQRRVWHEVYRRLLVEARGLLERVIQMDASPTRHAWAWRDLARTLNWLRAPASDVLSAFEKALQLQPDEPRFAEELERYRERQKQRSHGRTARGGRNGRPRR